MRVARLDNPEDFDGWREAARSLALLGVPAADIDWQVAEEMPGLFS